MIKNTNDKIENELESTQLFLDMVLSISPDLFFRYNLKDDVMRYYGSAREVLGLPEEIRDYSNTVNQYIHIHPDDVAEVEKQIENVKCKIEESCDFRIINKNGSTSWHRKKIKLCYDNHGNIVEAIGRVSNVQEQKAMELKISYDSLTGCYRKKIFENMAIECLELLKDQGHSLMIVDLDNFKAVNDNLGHQFGDMVLREVGEKLSGLFRSTDYVGRIGGDEFMIFIKNTSDKTILKSQAQRVVEALDITYKGANHSYRISASIGISTYPDNGKTFKELYNNADIALFDAKNRGKNGYAFYETTLSKGTMENTLPFDIASRTLSQHFDSKIIAEVFNLLFETTEMELSIASVLRIIGQRFGVCRSYVFESSSDGTDCYHNSYEWCNKGVTSEKEKLQNLTMEDFWPVFSNANSDGIIYCNDFEILNSESAQDILENQSIESILHAYIRSGNKFSYMVGFDDCNSARVWSPIEIATLLYVSKIIAQFLNYNKTLKIAKTSSEERLRVLDSLNYSAYIIDIQTHKLSYFNRYTKKLLPEIQLGDVCYKTIRNKECECSDCPLKTMRETKEQTTRCVIYNSVLDVKMLVNASRLVSFDGKESIFVSANEI